MLECPMGCPPFIQLTKNVCLSLLSRLRSLHRRSSHACGSGSSARSPPMFLRAVSSALKKYSTTRASSGRVPMGRTVSSAHMNGHPDLRLARLEMDAQPVPPSPPIGDNYGPKHDKDDIDDHWGPLPAR